MSELINVFNHKNSNHKVKYIETTYPNNDVECDVYEFVEDTTRDLAILRIKPNGKTPRQKVLQGDETLEGYISGSGKFCHNGETHEVPGLTEEFRVEKGDVMQWQAGEDELVCYELCTPPYADGRFEDLI